MKLAAFVAVLAFLVLEGNALKCHQFMENSFNGLKNEMISVDCEAKKTMCVSLQYTAVLPSDESHVKFQQGLCSTPSLCHQFCGAVKSDEDIKARIPQCQVQCCSQDDCNRQLL